MMCHTDIGSTDILPKLLKITVAQFACCHLNAYLMQSCVNLCIKMNYMKWYILNITQILNEQLIAKTLFAAQLEIAMDSLYTVAHTL